MNINIIRGQNQIGGNVIELSTDTTKIIFDVGLELDDDGNAPLPKIDGLFDSKGYDAVFISHYHSDHMGLAYNVFKDIPVYMGEKSFKIIRASDIYKHNVPLMISGFLEHKTTIEVGDIKVTPYLCDHSAFDSYMLLAEADGQSVLYTGDFRSNGRKPFGWILKQLPKNTDVLICEGTTLTRPNSKAQAEAKLEEDAVELFKKHNGPVFVLQSTTNIDRIVTMYRAAKRTGRIFLQDLYMAEITTSIGDSIPNPMGFDDVKTFITRPYDKEHYRYQLFDRYGNSKIGKSRIAKSRFVMCVRSSMLNYLKSLNKELSFEDGLLIYSMWEGYKAKPEMEMFLAACEDMGLSVCTLHTSGHADEQAISKLIEMVNPKAIMPVHTENSAWFKDNYPAKCISIS